MQTKFNLYMNELNKIIHTLKSFPSLDEVSSKDFKLYKTLISRKEYLQMTINNMLNQRANIIGIYNEKNQKWLSSDINCRKYYRLEQSAAYQRDLSLYKAGFTSKKPSPPFIKQLHTFISEKFIQPISNNLPFIKKQINSDIKSITSRSPICNVIKKGQNYIKTELPASLTKMAISSTKKCIVSYRNFSNRISSFTRSISTSLPIRTLSFIISQAKQQVDNPQPEIRQTSFMAHLQVNPQTFEYLDQTTQRTGYYGNGRQIVQFHNCSPVPRKNNNIERTK